MMAEERIYYHTWNGEKYHIAPSIGEAAYCGINPKQYAYGINTLSPVREKHICKKCASIAVNPNVARDTTSKAQEH